MGKVIYRELSYRVMQAVFEVHNTLGPGFLESVYEEALACEFELRGISFERQMAVTVTYKGEVVGTHRLDLVVDGKIVLELKAAGLKLGILINFGTPRVEYVRIAN